MILDSTLSNIEARSPPSITTTASLLHYLSITGLPKPPALSLAAGFAVNAGLRRALEADPVDQAMLRSFLSLAKADQVQLETASLSYSADQRMKFAMVALLGSPRLDELDRALALARALVELPFEPNLWQAQNIWYEMLRKEDAVLATLPAENRSKWQEDFAALGQCLSIDTAAIAAQDAAAVTTGD